MFKTKRLYKKLKYEFESVGTLLINTDMYYTATHKSGLWLCERLMDNSQIIVGLIPWSNISRMVLDYENLCVYIELSDYQAFYENANFHFKMYKSFYIHTMSDSGEKAIKIPMDLLNSSVINSISSRIPTVEREEDLSNGERVTGVVLNIISVIAVLCIVLGLLAGYIL